MLSVRRNVWAGESIRHDDAGSRRRWRRRRAEGGPITRYNYFPRRHFVAHSKFAYGKKQNENNGKEKEGTKKKKSKTPTRDNTRGIG